MLQKRRKKRVIIRLKGEKEGKKANFLCGKKKYR
jgi:hypothetical protein